jgi:hypothetical protein
MKCLSIRPPWATLTILGVKRLENRSWPAPLALIGQRIAIQASAGAMDLASWSEIVSGPPVSFDEGVTVIGVELPPLSRLPRSVTLGTVELLDCVADIDLLPDLACDAFAGTAGYCWILGESRPLPRPFTCKSKLRLWDAQVGVTLA